jgi:hypothetical protein
LKNEPPSASKIDPPQAVFFSCWFLIQVARARARGYRTTKNLIAAIYLFGGNLKLGLPTWNSEEPFLFTLEGRKGHASAIRIAMLGNNSV